VQPTWDVHIARNLVCELDLGDFQWGCSTGIHAFRTMRPTFRCAASVANQYDVEVERDANALDYVRDPLSLGVVGSTQCSSFQPSSAM